MVLKFKAGMKLKGNQNGARFEVISRYKDRFNGKWHIELKDIKTGKTYHHYENALRHYDLSLIQE